MHELQKSNSRTKEQKKNPLKNREDIEGSLYHQILLYISEIICSEMIYYHQNNSFTEYFEIKKTKELVTKKYFYLTLFLKVHVYMRSYDIYLASQRICHELYKDLSL